MQVNLSFLQVGHTHADIDVQFSCLADILQRNESETMPQLLSLLNGSRQAHELFDIKSLITPYLNAIKQHSKPLHFRFNQSTSSDSNIVFGYRSNCKRPLEILEQTLLIDIPTVSIFKPEKELEKRKLSFRIFFLRCLTRNSMYTRFVF